MAEITKNVYVVTCPENGWDCVIGVYVAHDKEQVYQYLADEQGRNVDDDEIQNRYIVHSKTLESLI